MSNRMKNDSTPIRPDMRDGGRGAVQCLHDGTNDASLYGSLNGVDYTLIETFSGSVIKEVVLVPTMLISSTTAADITTATAADVAGTTRVYISETRN